MRIVDRLAQREANWRELDRLLHQGRFWAGNRSGRSAPEPRAGEVVWLDESSASNRAEAPPPRTPAEQVLRLGELYRAACADLMLAEAHDLPRETVAYLHDLVARAHNTLYRSRGFRFSTWAGELLQTVPRRLRSDRAFWLSALLFWGPFLIAGVLAASRPEFTRTVLGPEMINQLEEMYAEPIGQNPDRDDAAMAGFYVFNNAGIGLRCFAWGLTFGLGTIYLLVQNGLILGTSFGHMLTSPYAGNFSTFVTAHGPFELTAVVFAGAAGLRLGWGLIDHQGQTRLGSLRREAIRALPTVGASVLLFVLAAFLEGFVSASRLPYAVKAAIALASAAGLIAYLTLGGRPALAPSVEE
jgi:uncharacterized membrane protein SpoIIM required for sporulation